MTEDAMDEAEFVQEVREFVHKMVARGDRSFDAVLEEAVEYFLEADENSDTSHVEKVCNAEIEKAFAEHLQRQETWPEVTDCDRLDAAFEALNDGGIVAMHDFTCCQNCGLAEIGAEIGTAKEAGVDVVGFAFYHSQDTDAAAAGHGIYLTYGHVDGGEVNGVAVGRVIVTALEEAGLKIVWDGTMGKRINVPLIWQRRIAPEDAKRDAT
jgi:hypothetical protein